MDGIIPHYLYIEERRDAGQLRRRWIRGLIMSPQMLFSDSWHFDRITRAVFMDYYATIAFDLSSPYSDWKKWVHTWQRIQGNVTRSMIDVNRFSEPHIFSLAEIAYFFANSVFVRRLDTYPAGNQILPAKDARLARKISSDDPRPQEHIIVNVRGGRDVDNRQAGRDTDSEHDIFSLVMKAIDIGHQHRVGNPLSREGFRRKNHVDAHLEMPSRWRSNFMTLWFNFLIRGRRECA